MQLLEEFNFTLEHKPGVENVVADALSQKDIMKITIITNDDWLNRIKKLTEILPIKEGLTEKHGLFYKDSHLYIPPDQDAKTFIIAEYHDSDGSHFGIKKTLT